MLESVMISSQPLECDCIYKRHSDKPPLHWFPLNFIVCHFPFDDVIQGAQAEKNKHSRIHTRTHTHRHTFIQNLYVHARFIRVQFLYRATNSFEMEKIHQQRVTNSIWKSLNQIYLACFPFGYTSYTVFSFFFSI